MVEEDRQVSKFSSGVNILLRLDSLWKDANSHSRNGQYSKWNEDLDVIWRELARDLSDTEYKSRKTEFDGFDARLIEIGRFNDTGNETFDKDNPKDATKRSKHYKILNEKELLLRRLENFLGKGTTWDEDDDGGFD